MDLSDVNNEQLKRITNGLIELDIVDGANVGFRVGGKSFGTIEAATDFITGIRMTNRETFQASKTLVDYLRAPSGLARGIQTPDGLINMAQRIGGSRRIEVYQLDTQSMAGEVLPDGTMTGDYASLKSSFTNEAGEYTALIMPGKTTVVQQYFDENLDRYLTADEIIGLHREHSIVPFNEKAPKRYRQMTRDAEIMGEVDKRYVVGVYDNEAVLRETYKNRPEILSQITATKAAIAADGQSLMSPAVIEDLERMVRNKKLEVENLTGPDAGPIDKAAIAKYNRMLDELKGLKVHGGRFNYRIDVFDFAGSSNLSNEEIDALQKMIGAPKGDVLVPEGGMEAWHRLVNQYGGAGGFMGSGPDALDPQDVHFLSTIESIPNDAGEYAKRGIARTRNSQVILSPHNIIKDTWLDPQHLTAHPDLFTTQALHDETMAHFNRSLSKLQETGTLTPGMIDQMRQNLDDGDKILSDFNKSDRYTAHVLDFLDAGGNLNDSPEIMRMAVGSLERFYQDPDYVDRIKMMMPDAVRAPISPYDKAYETARKRDKLSTILPMTSPEDMPQGSVTYVPGRGIAFHPLDFSLITEAGGGSDFDDYYVAHLRRIEGSDDFAAVMTRSPTTKGEQIVMNVDQFDPLTEEVLKRKDPRYTFLSKMKKIDAASSSYYNTEEQLKGLQEALDDIHAQRADAFEIGNSSELTKLDDKIKDLHRDFKNAQRRLKARSKKWDSALGDSLDSIESVFGPDEVMRRQIEDISTGGIGIDRGRYHDNIVDLLEDAHIKTLRETVQSASAVQLTDLSKTSVSAGLLSDITNTQLQDPHDLYRLVDKDGNAITAAAYDDSNKKSIVAMYEKQRAMMDKAFLGDDAVAQVAQTSEELKALGGYSNAKMIADDMLRMGESELSKIKDILGHDFKFDIPQLEQVIDSATSGGGGINYGEKLKREVGAVVAQVMHQGGDIRLGIDKTLFEDKARGAGGEDFTKGFQDYWTTQMDASPEAEADLLARYGASSRADFFESKVKFEDNLVEGQYTENIMARKLAKVEMTREANKAKAAAKYNAFYSNQEFAKQAHTDADFLEELYRKSRAVYDGMPPSIPGGIDAASLMHFPGYDTVMEQGADDLIGRDLMHGARLLATDETAGDKRLFEAVGVLKQRYNENAGRGYSASASILDAGGNETRSMRDVSLATDRFYGAFADYRDVAPEDIRIPHGIGGDISDNVVDIAKEFYGENRLARSTIGDVASQGLLGMREGFTRLGQVHGVKQAAIAGLAVVAGSIMYQRHKDRTYQDMEGPPLLPGGSSYEDYPVETAQIPSAVGGSVARGTTYDIYATGNFNQGDINSRISEIAGVSPSVYSYKGRSKASEGRMDQYVSRKFG